jgi:hypothetical protein
MINQNHKKKRGLMMSIFSLIGIILLVSALVLFAYQGISAFLGMGTSDEFVYENVSFVDILDEEFFSWVDSIQSIAETLIYTPIALWMLCVAVLCFLIHAFTGTKHIK